MLPPAEPGPLRGPRRDVLAQGASQSGRRALAAWRVLLRRDAARATVVFAWDRLRVRARDATAAHHIRGLVRRRLAVASLAQAASLEGRQLGSQRKAVGPSRGLECALEAVRCDRADSRSAGSASSGPGTKTQASGL